MGKPIAKKISDFSECDDILECLDLFFSEIGHTPSDSDKIKSDSEGYFHAGRTLADILKQFEFPVTYSGESFNGVPYNAYRIPKEVHHAVRYRGKDTLKNFYEFLVKVEGGLFSYSIIETTKDDFAGTIDLDIEPISRKLGDFRDFSKIVDCFLEAKKLLNDPNYETSEFDRNFECSLFQDKKLSDMQKYYGKVMPIYTGKGTLGNVYKIYQIPDDYKRIIWTRQDFKRRNYFHVLIQSEEGVILKVFGHLWIQEDLTEWDR